MNRPQLSFLGLNTSENTQKSFANRQQQHQQQSAIFFLSHPSNTQTNSMGGLFSSSKEHHHHGGGQKKQEQPKSKITEKDKAQLVSVAPMQFVLVESCCPLLLFCFSFPSTRVSSCFHPHLLPTETETATGSRKAVPEKG